MKYDRITKVLLGIITAGLWTVAIIFILPKATIN
jgi:hypothetical protein